MECKDCHNFDTWCPHAMKRHECRLANFGVYDNINFKVLIKEIHENAVNHGWWKEERSIGTIVSLMHSELSEALEHWRKYEQEAFIDINGKPDGIFYELADVIIRILDYFGSKEVYMEDFSDSFGNDFIWLDGSTDFGTVVAVSHLFISKFFEENMEDKKISSQGLLYRVISLLFNYITNHGYDPGALIKTKHEYNKTRPYKHRGKKA